MTCARDTERRWSSFEKRSADSGLPDLMTSRISGRFRRWWLRRTGSVRPDSAGGSRAPSAGINPDGPRPWELVAAQGAQGLGHPYAPERDDQDEVGNACLQMSCAEVDSAGRHVLNLDEELNAGLADSSPL